MLLWTRRSTSVVGILGDNLADHCHTKIRSLLLAAELRQKVIPWLKTPFDSRQNEPGFDEKTLPAETTTYLEEAEQILRRDVEPVPEWLQVRPLFSSECQFETDSCMPAIFRPWFVTTYSRASDA
jgi:hypothetical protein